MKVFLFFVFRKKKKGSRAIELLNSIQSVTLSPRVWARPCLKYITHMHNSCAKQQAFQRAHSLSNAATCCRVASGVAAYDKMGFFLFSGTILKANQLDKVSKSLRDLDTLSRSENPRSCWSITSLGPHFAYVLQNELIWVQMCGWERQFHSKHRLCTLSHSILCHKNADACFSWA